MSDYSDPQVVFVDDDGLGQVRVYDNHGLYDATIFSGTTSQTRRKHAEIWAAALAADLGTEWFTNYV